MGLMGNIKGDGIGKLIDGTSKVILEGIDKITKAGFNDYAEIDEPISGDENLENKKDIMGELEKAPLNIELREKLIELNERDFELKMKSIHEEIVDILR